MAQSQNEAYAALTVKDTLSSPFGLDSARPTLGLTDVRAQPSKKRTRGMLLSKQMESCLILLPLFRLSSYTET